MEREDILKLKYEQSRGAGEREIDQARKSRHDYG